MYSSQRLFMEQKMDTNRLTFNYLSRYTSVIGIQIIIRYYICKALFVTFKNKIYKNSKDMLLYLYKKTQQSNLIGMIYMLAGRGET